MAGSSGSSGEGAAFFDVDRTLIAGASALRLVKPLRRSGLLTRRQQVRAALVQLNFSLRGADTPTIERFQAAAEGLIAGWNQAEFRALVERELERHVRPSVFTGALERIDMHRAHGQRVYAVSATIEDIVEPLADLLGLDGAVASSLEVVDGEYTGQLGRICHGEGKAERLREFASLHHIDLAASSAYSDSISDADFLRAVGRPYAVNPDKELRQLAEEEGWGILWFRDTVEVPLHRRRGVRAAAAFMVAAFAAVFVHRSRRDS